ncbi:MAG: DNA-directed polymerase subunit alpha [Candidatus Atribacteria bacterium]|nr:DNA-directed polymerase subunit alpha [Candidatus Atribacteria bacterium]
MQELKGITRCEILEIKENPKNHYQYGKFVIEPLESGWGTTVGNALRRVLLSSMEGAAVTGIQVEEVIHEFSALPGVREDITDIVLNVKGLVLRSFSPEEETLELDVQGKPGEVKVVSARDIKKNANVEIVNPDHYLAEIEQDGHLSMKLFVNRGRGYQPAVEGNYSGYNIIPLDAIFSPIRKVNYQVLDTRVGQFTNYDKLVFEIWTNGAISPQEALENALRMVEEKFAHLLGLFEQKVGEASAPPVVDEVEEPEENAKEKIPIDELELSVRAYNCLKRAKIETLQDLLFMMQERPNELKKIKNLGQKTYQEILHKLEALGYHFGDDGESEVDKDEA